MYLVSHLAAPQLGVVLLGDAGEGVVRFKGHDCSGKACLTTASPNLRLSPTPPFQLNQPHCTTHRPQCDAPDGSGLQQRP
jgi:hypothetical protein